MRGVIGMALAVLVGGCGSQSTEIRVARPPGDVTAGFFIGGTASGENLAFAVSSIRSVFFVCGGVEVFHVFEPAISLGSDRSFTLEFEEGGRTFTIAGRFLDDDSAEGAISGDPACEGPFQVSRCDPDTQNCADVDGDLIPDEVDPDVSSPPPSTPAPTSTSGSPGPTATPGSGSTATPGSGPTATATPSACSATVEVSLTGFPQPNVVNAIIVNLDYPTGVTIPADAGGSGAQGSLVAGRVSNCTGVGAGNFVPLDQSTARRVRMTLVAGFSSPPNAMPAVVPAGLFAQAVFDCDTPPTAGAFSCSVGDAANGEGDPVATGSFMCSVAIPASPSACP
jgi:hypothetical protein